MEEQVNQKTMSMAIQTGQSAGRALRSAIQMYLRHRQNIKNKTVVKNDIGPKKMKIKDLVGTGSGVSKLQIKDDDIKEFERTARKFGVKYSINKDKSTDPPTFYFFFQSKDTDVINKAFQDFLGKQLKREKKPTIAQTMQKFKALVASVKNIEDKTRNKEQVR